MLIQLIIVWNSKVIAVLCFEWKQFLTILLILYLLCTHIHTLSLTSIILILYSITFLLQFIMWRGKYRKNNFFTWGCWPQQGRRTHLCKSSVSLSLCNNSNEANQSYVRPIRERGIFNTNPAISLSGSTFLMAAQMGACTWYGVFDQ